MAMIGPLVTAKLKFARPAAENISTPVIPDLIPVASPAESMAAIVGSSTLQETSEFTFLVEPFENVPTAFS